VADGRDVAGGRDAAGGDAARDALFELAVARATAYLRARPPATPDPAGVRQALEPWALKTRFASRVDLDAVARAIAARPAGATRWRGGPTGGWG